MTGDWLASSDPNVPERVRHVDPPCAGFWFAGDPALLWRGLRIGIVGSRHPRGDALAVARRIAGDVARAGCTVVSGLAIGIDGAAHEQARAVDGGRSIAVVAGGLALVHPVRNRQLARELAGSARPKGVASGAHADAMGLVISEYGCGEEDSQPYRFRDRNRLIAALSDYLVVVQAASQSGSMGTARHALNLGVPIGIVPSAPSDSAYIGGIGLLRDGADAVIDGRSLFLRLEAHGIVESGCADAVDRGARIDPYRPHTWSGPVVDSPRTDVPLHGLDHPLASLVHVPRSLDEIAALAGIDIASTRRLLMDLEEVGGVTHADDGLWVAPGRRSRLHDGAREPDRTDLGGAAASP